LFLSIPLEGNEGKKLKLKVRFQSIQAGKLSACHSWCSSERRIPKADLRKWNPSTAVN